MREYEKKQAAIYMIADTLEWIELEELLLHLKELSDEKKQAALSDDV